jgi:two-component system response regulator MtrA
MSAFAVADPTAANHTATRPAVADPDAPALGATAPARRPVRRPRAGGTARLRSVGASTTRSPAPEVAALDPAARARSVLDSPAPGVDASGGDPSVGPVTVTISIAVGDQARRGRVLTALRDLIEAAGPDAAVAGTGLAGSGRADVGGADAGAAGVRSAGLPGAPADVVERPVVLDPLPRTVLLDGHRLELSRLEYDLLLFLGQHPRQVFSRSQLLSQVWGHTHTGARTIDVHVSRLRTKLGPDRDAITTVYGLGYRLSDDVPITIINR